MDEPVMILTTCKDDAEAQTISHALIERKLIGCANILPVKSVYRWKGKIEQESESMLMCKTTDDKYDAAAKIIKELHSYDMPQVEKVKVDTMDSDYLRWLVDSLEKTV